MDIAYKSITELHELLSTRQISATELTKSYLQTIERQEAAIKAYVTVTGDEALKQAAEVDRKIQSGQPLSPLEGIPMALKDNICTEGILTTCASKMLQNFIPPYSATVAERLRKNGAILLGKANMDEFAMGSSTENSGFFPTKNPWDFERVPGGSSGGSAAAVAASEAVYALGTDTGGSIRQPAAFCGLVGLKPTYGLVSRFGVVAFASSLDQVGPMTLNVRDNALVLNAIAGHDPADSTSVAYDKPDYTQFLVNDIKGLKIGLPREYVADGIDPEVEKVIRQAVNILTDLGAHVEECSLPHTEYAVSAYYLIATAEASSNLARFDGVRYGYRVEDAEDVIEMCSRSRAEGFGPEVKLRIMLGTYALSAGYYDAYYLKAQKVRTLIKNDFEKAFENFDLILTPTAPSIAFKFGEKADPLAMYLHDIYTIPVSLAGLPAISLPAGFVKGMPVGMQLIAKHFGEGMLYRAAYTFEQNTEFHKAKPQIKEVV